MGPTVPIKMFFFLEDIFNNIKTLWWKISIIYKLLSMIKKELFNITSWVLMGISLNQMENPLDWIFYKIKKNKLQRENFKSNHPSKQFFQFFIDTYRHHQKSIFFNCKVIAHKSPKSNKHVIQKSVFLTVRSQLTNL